MMEKEDKTALIEVIIVLVLLALSVIFLYIAAIIKN